MVSIIVGRFFIIKHLENNIVNVVVRKHLAFERVCQNKRNQYGVHNFDFYLTGENFGEYNYQIIVSTECIGLLFDLGMHYYQQTH